ncbi:unnamed protein product [Rhizoctonia solani]|uniref:Protein kinase domain-containing protein n=1 Tax=Rhizoctonia solani TaxID=456999 RepID=A0A8H3DRR7_9AGAM|nr:unnamed protein product [Rhizoctonia solani]
MPPTRCIDGDKCTRSYCEFIHPDQPQWSNAPKSNMVKRRRVEATAAAEYGPQDNGYSLRSKGGRGNPSNGRALPERHRRHSSPPAWGGPSSGGDWGTSNGGGWGAESSGGGCGAPFGNDGWGNTSGDGVGNTSGSEQGNPEPSPRRPDPSGPPATSHKRVSTGSEGHRAKRRRGLGADVEEFSEEATPNAVGEDKSSSIGVDPTTQVIGHTTPLGTIINYLTNHGCPDVSSQLKNIDEHSRYSGSLSDVYQARWPDGSLVAVKCLRALGNSDVPHGKLLKCAQIAAGLSYMHGLGLVHGDIKGNNVVVSEDGTAKITDFGSATMAQEFAIAFTATQSVPYSIRWAAPELFQTPCPRFESDVYAFAMTVLEALTGDIPHKGLSDFVIMRRGFEGKLPDRPIDHIPARSKKGDKLWNLLTRCWHLEPVQRPAIREVYEFINDMTQRDLHIQD